MFEPYFIILLFIALWWIICVSLSRISGWWYLAKYYPRTTSPNGKAFYLASASIGGINYSSCLTIHTNTEGIFFSIWPIFRLGTPPFYLPKSAITNLHLKKFLWIKRVSFVTEGRRKVTIILPEKVVRQLDLLHK